MSPDAATAYLDSSETQARAMVLNRAEQQLRNMGLSEQGVMTVIKGLGSLSDSIGTGVEQYGTSKETGKHALAGLSKADAELFTKWGSRVGWAGNIAQLVIAGIDKHSHFQLVLRVTEEFYRFLAIDWLQAFSPEARGDSFPGRVAGRIHLLRRHGEVGIGAGAYSRSIWTREISPREREPSRRGEIRDERKYQAYRGDDQRLK